MSSAASCLLLATRQLFASISIIAGWLTPRLEQQLSNKQLDQCGGVRRCTFRLIRGRYWFATNKSRCHESAQSVGAAGCSPSTRYRGCPTLIRTVRCRRIGGSSVSRECHKSVRSDLDSFGRQCTKTVANKQISSPLKFMRIHF